VITEPVVPNQGLMEVQRQIKMQLGEKKKKGGSYKTIINIDKKKTF